MDIRRFSVKSLVAVAATSVLAGLCGCVNQDQPATQANATPQEEARPRPEPPPPPTAVRPNDSGTSTTARKPAPRQPAPKPAPSPARVTVPEGTEVHMSLASPVGSATSQVGDAVIGTTTTPIVVGDHVAIPVGSTIHGRVTGVDPATKGLKVGEKGGTVVLSFTKVTTPNGDSSPMSGSLTSEGKSDGKTAGIIGGSAAGGAILGKILGGSTKDAAIGAVIGSGIGTGIAAGTKGTEVVLPVGTDLLITLDRPLTIAGRS